MTERIRRIFNNNALLAINEKGQEVIYVGRGLAYGCSKGDIVRKEYIDKTFSLSSDHNEKFTELIEEFSLEDILLAEKAISYIKQKSKDVLSDSIYVTLTDHISIMLERIRKGCDFDYTSLLNIKQLYHEEFKIAEGVVDLISQDLKMEIPKAEANFITLHIVNASTDSNIVKVYKITNMMTGILNIVKTRFDISETDNIDYDRFVTHCRFLVNRIIDQQKTNLDSGKELKAWSSLISIYDDENECVNEITDYLLQKYNYSINKEERLYLMLHLAKLTR
ncbi:PRD domain-containing protein [Faecalicoccus pleomorphus]|uniref:PRD domain-containing protein n=1 Tax=Faecalicoccus pleomorphus TaxID=1323 RepID=A0AAW6CRP9_9FIRM|nr:PRD domain-containing protein [Faecalicoccus pleomorphus]MDB7979302.1 PRD domain-containing protein [Faecalicoccus pleomorphus]MDB7981566.1 PRD domain-containing protein [Faecalicoccus pleomorphus]